MKEMKDGKIRKNREDTQKQEWHHKGSDRHWCKVDQDIPQKHQVLRGNQMRFCNLGPL